MEPTHALHIGAVEYLLQGLVIFLGSAQRGHYWSLARHIVQGNDWRVCYNDSIRRDAKDNDFQGAEEAEVLAASGQFYMLFYSRRGEQRLMQRDRLSGRDRLSREPVRCLQPGLDRQSGRERCECCRLPWFWKRVAQRKIGPYVSKTIMRQTNAATIHN